MNELQKKILNIMKTVHMICEKNDIKYSLCGGSMIGAVRETGFIPWDDDIDIFMSLNEYKKFIDVVQNCFFDNLEFLIPEKTDDYYYPFMKVVDNSTTFWEKHYEDNIQAAKGVFIDVFPVCSVKDKKMLKRNNRNRYFWFKLCKAKLMKTEVTLKKILVKPLACMVTTRQCIKKMLKYNIYRSDYGYVYDPDGYNNKSMVPKEWFDEYILMPFEDAEFYVIKEYDKYLTQVFGNYMERPPIEQQVSHHNYAYLDLNKPYKQYIAEYLADKNIKTSSK